MLRRVRIRGFKSFAGDVTLELGPGVNVIVGPNGSGKSNFGEAISWALGEQRSGRLRAPGMQDILYQGTEARPSAGLAEVALQLDGDVAGPAELEVSRRLTRAGESSYLLNGAACRLLDLHESLSERGLGGDSLAIIRQGQVEALATSRPAERRAMVDEAAGVGVTKRRRKRAEQKLARIADKLDRARDLQTEITSRARALDRQARAAERAAAYEAEILELRETDRAVRAIAAADGLAAAATTFAAAEQRDTEARTVAEHARQLRGQATEARSTAVATLEAVELLAQTIRSAGDRIAGRAELATERLTELEARQERLGHARADAARQLGRLQADAATARAERDSAATEISAAAAAVHAAEEAAIELASAERRAVEAVRAIGDDLASAEAAVVDIERRIAAATETLGHAAAQLTELERPADDASAARIERRADIAQRREERHAQRHAEATAEWEGAVSELRRAEARHRDAVSEARLLASDEDVDPGGPTLGDGLEVTPGLERAVAAAIGACAEALIARDLAAARAAIDGGGAIVVVPAPAPQPIAPPFPGARPVRDAIVACAPDAAAHVERLVADAWIVDDLAGVPASAAGLFVTPDGVAYRPSHGVVSTARSSWARRALAARAAADAEAAERDVARLIETVAATAERREGARRRAGAAERSRGAIIRELSAVRVQAASRAERSARLRADHDEAQRILTEAHRTSEESARSRADLAAALDTARSVVAEARQTAAEAHRNHEEQRDALHAARAEFAALDARAADATAVVAAARELVGAADMLPGDLALVAGAVTALQDSAEALVPVVTAVTEEVAVARSAFASTEERLAATTREVEQADAAHAIARDALHAAEVDVRIAEERVNEAGPAPSERPAELPDPSEVAERLADLERRRLAIGAVNELASSERAELAEREAHLAEQIQDLADSSASLTTHLGELDAAVGDGFDAVFQSVSDRFAEVVEMLFPGGTGRLRLVEPDEDGGDPGIEVEVVPKGKRPRALSLMSGGERSLIAMAFCLALAMARPAPFYVLDEVEAALDDANLRRFLGVVTQLAAETQFVVITHQQPTVEIADTLFGVTMGGDGVTQVVSRKLSRTIEEAQPYVRRQLRLVNAR